MTRAACVLMLAWSAPLAAIYLLPQLEDVPVDRLVANLERMVVAEPANLMLRNNLARAHAMAFVARTPTLRIGKNDERSGPYVAPSSPYVPFATPVAKPGTMPLDAARAHLQAAIRTYEDLLKLDPTQYLSRLGYGWCLEQSGAPVRAKEEYRRVISDTWPKEKGQHAFDALQGPVTAEAIQYLLPLLDPARDKEEISRLRSMQQEIERMPRAITPIAVPLAPGVGVDRLLDRRARVRFDADGTALGGEWTWISKEDAGWLVYDQQSSGKVTSALQLFGSVTFWMFWNNGYDALRALDDNGDGTLRGDELKGVALWRDADGNGISGPGEVLPVRRWGIVAISCAHEIDDESDLVVASSASGVTFADGTTRPTYDVLLQKHGARGLP